MTQRVPVRIAIDARDLRAPEPRGWTRYGRELLGAGVDYLMMDFLAEVTMSLLANFAGMPALLPWAHALEAVLYFYAVAGLIRYMLGDMRVTTDELVSAATTFTLLAWAFAYAFSACQAWVPGSFSEVSVPPQPRTPGRREAS